MLGLVLARSNYNAASGTTSLWHLKLVMVSQRGNFEM